MEKDTPVCVLGNEIQSSSKIDPVTLAKRLQANAVAVGGMRVLSHSSF